MDELDVRLAALERERNGDPRRLAAEARRPGPEPRERSVFRPEPVYPPIDELTGHRNRRQLEDALAGVVDDDVEGGAA